MITPPNTVSGGASASGSGTDVTTSVSFTVSTKSPSSDPPGGSPANPPVNSNTVIINKFNIADYWWVFLIMGVVVMLGMVVISRWKKRKGTGAVGGSRGMRFGKLGRYHPMRYR